jgi:tetratricopeptide (TPR) repeat protein
MSPEQFGSSSVDARSDIYSLGCLMYETVSGRKVFQVSDPMSWMLSHAQVIPESFSTFANLNAKSRFYRPVELVILKCLEKQPQLRYQKVSELRADLMRLKAGKKPLLRKQNTALEVRVPQTINRFTSVMSGCVLILFLMAFLLWHYKVEVGSSVWQHLFYFGNSCLKRKEYGFSELYFVAAQSAADLSFEQNDSRNLTTLRKLIAVYEAQSKQQDAQLCKARLKLRIGDQPSEEWKRLAGQANFYIQRAEYRTAAAILRAALRESKKNNGLNIVVAETLFRLGETYYKLRDLRSAEACARESLRIKERLLEQDNLQIAECLSWLGGILYEQKKYDDAILVQRECLRMYLERQGPYRKGYIGTLLNLALLARSKGDVIEAVRLYEKCLSAVNHTSDRHLKFIVLSNFSDVYLDLGKPQQCYDMAKQALAFATTADESSWDHIYTSNLHAIGHACLALNRLSEAEESFSRAIYLIEKHGINDPLLVDDYLLRAVALSRMGKHKQAKESNRRALELYRKYPWMKTKNSALSGS